MRIRFYIPGLIGGGAERVVVNLANYFSEYHGYDVSVITLVEQIDTYNISPKVKIYPLWHLNEKAPGIIRLTKKLYRFVKISVREQADVNFIFLYPFNVIGLLFSKLIRGKVVCTERNYPGSYSWYRMCLIDLLSNLADAWVFQTEDAKKMYSSKIKNQYIIPNAVKMINPPNDIVRENKIVAVGRLHPQKNFRMLIKAFSIIVDKFPEYNLCIYGQGNEYENLLNEVSELKIEGKVHFMGFVHNVHQQILSAEIFAMSSDYEGIPNALLEAMALGVPCVSTDCLGGGARLLIKNKENGILVPRNDAKAMANAIIELIENKELREKLSSNACRVRDDYSEKVIFEYWHDVCKKVLK